jgi:hypothetical protein
MDVSDWCDSPPPSQVKSARRYSLPPTLIGIIATLLLHAMFIQTLAFGGRGVKSKPPEIQQASSLSKSGESDKELILLSLPTTNNSNQTTSQPTMSSLPNLAKMKVSISIGQDLPQSLDFETLALSEDQPSYPATAGADGTEQARLYGIYTGQIQARIDRVWRRPRTPINKENALGSDSESFQCEAQIVQDTRGNVQEILLPRCNGSSVWQHSLVMAIQQASPMPAAPDAKVFRTSITLSFVGLAYRQGESEESYELPPRKLVGSN